MIFKLSLLSLSSILLAIRACGMPSSDALNTATKNAIQAEQQGQTSFIQTIPRTPDATGGMDA